MSDPSTGERRRLRRIIKRIPASFTCDGLHGQGHIKNISKEGVFMRVSELPEAGAPVRITIEPPDGPKVEIAGRVAWTTDQLPSDADAEPGFGLQLSERTDAFHDLLERILLG
ncbi:MAG: PilZ domain-containing protein [Myxococcota bacterium]